MMKKLFFFLNLILLFFSQLHATFSICPHHDEETNQIRLTAYESLREAHKLTGDIIGSHVITAEEMAWDAVRYNIIYSDFSKTFQGGIRYCNSKGKFLASSRLYIGLDHVEDLFLDLYNNCIFLHGNYRSLFERGKIHFDRGNSEECLSDIASLFETGMVEDLLKDVKPADLLITKAQAFLEVGEYEKAIEVLSDLIKKDPKNSEAYFQRAAAYFETGHFEEALKDYLVSNNKPILNNTFEAPKEFTQALLISICQGATEAAIDFVPSLCHSTYGLGEALWATHPLNPLALENTKNFTNACYEMGEWIFEYCKNLDCSQIDDCVEQFKVFYQKFDQLNSAEKGDLIGHMIGKYGVDLFAGTAVVKGVSTYRRLKTANKLCNFEAMMKSSANKEMIVASSLTHSSNRENFFKNIRIEWGKQNKHIIGTHNYDSKKSILDHPDPENLLKKYSGKGSPVRGKMGDPGYQEIVDFEEFIGLHICDQSGKKTPTTWGKIHYSKNGAHIVPARPKK